MGGLGQQSFDAHHELPDIVLVLMLALALKWRVGQLVFVTDQPVLPWPYWGVLRGGVMVLEGAGILARGTGSCT